jgi:hypothetical protein
VQFRLQKWCLLLKEGDIKYLDGKSKGSVELAGGLLQTSKAFCDRRLVSCHSSVASGYSSRIWRARVFQLRSYAFLLTKQVFQHKNKIKFNFIGEVSVEMYNIIGLRNL